MTGLLCSVNSITSWHMWYAVETQSVCPSLLYDVMVCYSTLPIRATIPLTLSHANHAYVLSVLVVLQCYSLHQVRRVPA